MITVKYDNATIVHHKWGESNFQSIGGGSHNIKIVSDTGILMALDAVIEHIRQFSAGMLFEGTNETTEQKIINSYAEGTIAGYNDAVKQIVDSLERMKEDDSKSLI